MLKRHRTTVGSASVRLGLILAVQLLNTAASAAATLAATATGLEERIVRIRALEREYFFFRPPQGSRSKLMPLVLVFHGARSNGMAMARQTQMNGVAVEKGVIVAYPSGLDRHWGDGRASAPANIAQGENDIEFVRKIIDDLIRNDGVDPARVYVTGFSNGGYFTFRVACQMSDRVTAIAAVASTMPALFSKPEACTSKEAIPMLLIWGSADPGVPFEGGPNIGSGAYSGPALGVKETIQFWVSSNRCRGKSLVERLPPLIRDGTEVSKETYRTCKGKSQVAFYKVQGAGHVWPGGTEYLPDDLRQPEQVIGKMTHNLDASKVIVDFFLLFRRDLR